MSFLCFQLQFVSIAPSPRLVCSDNSSPRYTWYHARGGRRKWRSCLRLRHYATCQPLVCALMSFRYSVFWIEVQPGYCDKTRRGISLIVICRAVLVKPVDVPYLIESCPHQELVEVCFVLIWSARLPVVNNPDGTDVIEPEHDFIPVPYVRMNVTRCICVCGFCCWCWKCCFDKAEFWGHLCCN